MSLRILIVKDEPIIALDLQAIVEDAGYTVAGVARRLTDALRVAASEELDVVIVDVILGTRPDGIEVCHRLRADHGVPSLFISSIMTNEIRERAMACRPVGFISKPFVAEEIVRALAVLGPSN